jgi:hypothetical protein
LSGYFFQLDNLFWAESSRGRSQPAFSRFKLCNLEFATAASFAEFLSGNSFAAEELRLTALMSVNFPPTSQITIVRRALNLYDKLFHQPQLIRVFFSEMLFANFCSLFLPVLGP